MSHCSSDLFCELGPACPDREPRFTPKAEGITDVMQMVTGKPRIDGQCVFDQSHPALTHDLDFDSVNDQYGVEYGISGMCITCQDGVFG